MFWLGSRSRSRTRLACHWLTSFLLLSGCSSSVFLLYLRCRFRRAASSIAAATAFGSVAAVPLVGHTVTTDASAAALDISQLAPSPTSPPQAANTAAIADQTASASWPSIASAQSSPGYDAVFEAPFH